MLLRHPSRPPAAIPPRSLRHLLCGLLFLLALGGFAAPGLRAAVIISEFMADNATTLQDENGDYSDWIEIHNNGATTVNLAGWALTDDSGDNGKWEFPAVSIGPGQFMVVFASAKDRRVPGQNLHTNFSLSATGEYLALVQPGGLVATEFANFPEQFPDKSYGIGQNVQVTQLVASNAPVRALIPTSGADGSNWWQTGFNHSTWLAGTNGVGFESTVPGFAVVNYKANIAVNSVTDAESVIATPSQRSATYTENKAVVNYLGTGDGAHHLGDSAFPGMTINVDVDDFVLQATGTVMIPAAGNWTFGVNSDDGFSLAVGAFNVSYPSPRGPGDTLATFNFPAAGEYPIRLVFYERGGGSEVELFAVQGAAGAWNSNFRLVGDSANGGLAVRSTPLGLGGYRPLIATDVQAQMLNANATAYVRIPFSVANVNDLTSLTLRVKYDDGFVAYVNGTKIAERNAPASPTWNSAATGPHANNAAVVYAGIDASAAIPLLQNGANNVLAIHAMNASAADGDFLILADLAEYETIGTTNHYFTVGTPGAVNDSASFAVTEPVTFSQAHGFFDAPFTVALSTPTPGATIRYTTNGSAPTATTGTVYTAPIAINGTTTLRAAAFKLDFEASTVVTQSYIFLSQVLQQPVLPAGFPSTWGAGVNADYEMDPAVVNDPAYAPTIANAMKSIPTISIVMDMNDLFGAGSGIYSNSTGEGIAWERAASVEWIDPTGGGHEFQVNCGIRPQGGASRNPGTSPKHGLRLLFKDVWGPSKLKFKMFKDSPVDEFDTITLHARFNDAWVWNGGSAQYIRDMWCRDTQLAMGRTSPRGTYVHLYLNGVYWGMYDPGEKPDASFSAQHFGGDKSEYDAVNSNEFIDGDGTAWNTMFTIARSGLASDANYAQLQQYLDVPGFIDYMILNLYAGNSDWPSHNWTASRRRVPGAGYQFYSWDAEWTFFGAGDDRIGVNDGNTPGELFQALRANAEFRRLFGDHVQRHFFNGGVLTPGPAEARWMLRATEIDQAIICESARWGDYRREPAYTRNIDWLGEQNRLRTQYFPFRTANVIAQFQAASLFPTIAAPAFSQHGGSVATGYALSITHSNAAGTILFTTDGTDPRLSGGGIAPSAQTYSTPIILNAHAVVRARVRDGTTWSALNEATFYTLQDFTPLAITEIMFNPPGAGAIGSDEFEFIELKNRGANTLDLSGLTFGGITLTFPGGTTLLPGAFCVLARNPVQFATRYPGVTVRGTFTGRLDNGGEQLSLTHPLGAKILSLTYGDHAPWPIAADGNGFSLVPLDFADPSNAASWRASANLYGSPGADDPEVSIARILVTEVLTHSAGQNFIELHNPNAGAVNVGGWFLSDDPGTPKKYTIPANTMIPAGGYITFTEAQFNPTPGVGNSFNLGSDGDEVCLLSGNGTNLTGFSHGFQFGAAAQGVTFGRYVNSVGEEQFPAQINPTPGAANSGPRVGPVVINEVHYHPETGFDEFVELKNISGVSLALYDPAVPANTWRLSGLNYVLPAGLSLPAGGTLLLVAMDPAEFRTKYSVPVEVAIVGPYPGVLQDSGERLQLLRPDAPGPVTVPYIVVDEVRYNDKAPWPTAADGIGPSLQRTVSTTYGNDPANWFASGPTPGTANVVNNAPVVTLLSPANGMSVPAIATISIEASALDSDGTITKVEFFNGATKLGEDTSAPYQYVWTNVAGGTYSITAKARDNRQATTVSEPAVIQVTAPPPGNGVGLRAEYYDTVVNFSALGGATPIVIRNDGPIGFDWGGGAPHPSMGVDSFSTRWTGQVQPRVSGEFAFYTYSDDGVRLWVNNQLIVDNWTDHAPTENAGLISLVAGQLYDVRMEFFENGGGAVAMLSWSAPGLSKELIPQSQLYPAGAPRIATQPLSQSVSAGGSVTFSTLASGTGPLTYQWYRGATPVGTNSPTLTISNLGAAHVGNYTVTATNGSGSATSAVAVLTVTNIDTDTDGIPDEWETANGLDPNNIADGALDADKDGQSNHAEYLAGTLPQNPQSMFKAEARRDAGGNPVVRFPAMTGKTYTVQWRAGLNSGTWTKLADVPSGAARTVDVADTTAIGVGLRFYRVVTPHQP